MNEINDRVEYLYTPGNEGMSKTYPGIIVDAILIGVNLLKLNNRLELSSQLRPV